MSTTSQRIREERLRLGMNQTNFGALGGVTKESQLNYESGERRPDTAYLERVAAGGADVLYILAGMRLKLVMEVQNPKLELDPDEIELLNDYRHIPEATRRGLRTVIASCAQVGSSLQRKHESPMQTMVAA